MPPREKRLSLFDVTEKELSEFVGCEKELDKKLLHAFEGVSPILVREWAYYATCREIGSIPVRLKAVIGKTARGLQSNNNVYTIVKTKDDTLKDFTFIEVQQYGSLMKTERLETACGLLDKFFMQRSVDSRLKQRAEDLFRILAQTSQRITKRIIKQGEDIVACAEKESLKVKGELLTGNLYKIPKGAENVRLASFYDGTEVEITLSPRLTASQNAQKYFNEYRKLATAEKVLAQQIESGKQELEYIDSIFDALTRAKTESEIDELRTELAEQGYIRRASKNGKGKTKALPPFEVKTSDGYTVLIGRNNKQNDQLTTKTAEKTDLWLHAHKMPGAHVIIRTNGIVPPEKTIEEAAEIAAFYSKGQNSSQVPIDCTLARYVKKPAGAKPGMVIFTHETTYFVEPKNPFKREG
jgi:predicted ribosome quality control (RQC) complex YloA/Tae2 family protein